MRYKILFISSWFPNKLQPTNGNFVQRHAEAVVQLHDVEILHAIGNHEQDTKYDFDDNVVNGIRTMIVYYKNSYNPILNFYRRMKAYSLGFEKLKKPDLVHANVLYNSMYFAIYLKKKFNIPFVVTEHWTALRKINSHKTSKIIKWHAKTIGNQASAILPVSQDLKVGLRNLGIKTQMEVVHNVVNTNLFSVKKTDNKVFTFIHVSNLIPRKNPEKILNVALRLLEKGFQFTLQIGGDGGNSKLNEIISSSKFIDRIEFFGIQTMREIAERMKRSDCFILFSDDENFPCVLLESLSTGTPAIATNVGGIPEIINGKNGILINKSEDELYEAMKKVLTAEIIFDEPKKLHEFVENRFSMDKIAQKFDQIYRQVLN